MIITIPPVNYGPRHRWVAGLKEPDESGERCDKRLDCGGLCGLRPDHEGPCSCDGDEKEPGDCPA